MSGEQRKNVSRRETNVGFLTRHGEKGGCAVLHSHVRLFGPSSLLRQVLGEVGPGLIDQMGMYLQVRASCRDQCQQLEYPSAVGHLRVRANGPRCSCGHRGCAEAYGGWGAIRRRYEEAGRPVSSPSVVLHDAETDPWARELLDEALEAIGFAAAALVAVCDPGTLRIGGGVAAAWGETLLAAIRSALETRVLPELAASTRVESAKLGDRASLLGLYALGRDA